MHEVNLNKYSLRTDLIVDKKDFKSLVTKKYTEEKITVTRSESNRGKKNYVTINFTDVTDKDNYTKVENIFVRELKRFIKPLNLKEKDSVLVVGLGNDKITPDSLGPLTIDNILVTKYLFSIGDVEKGYQNVCSFKPSVTGSTGIETVKMLKTLAKVSEAKCLIIIDALATSCLDRVNKTIQITDTGIHPGSGVKNNRGEVSKKTLNIPVIAIGIPTIVDAKTIVIDTVMKLQEFLLKQKINILGNVQNLDKNDFKMLLDTILTDESLMVTPKEVDFVMEKLSLLLGNGINKTLHKNFNTTK